MVLLPIILLGCQHPLLVLQVAFSSGTFMSSLCLYGALTFASDIPKGHPVISHCEFGASLGKAWVSQAPSLRSPHPFLFHPLLVVHSSLGIIRPWNVLKTFSSIIVLHLSPNWQIHLVYPGPIFFKYLPAQPPSQPLTHVVKSYPEKDQCQFCVLSFQP